eukprot:1141612-Pelagomonas_calceolata.AAC.2
MQPHPHPHPRAPRDNPCPHLRTSVHSGKSRSNRIFDTNTQMKGQTPLSSMRAAEASFSTRSLAKMMAKVPISNRSQACAIGAACGRPVGTEAAAAAAAVAYAAAKALGYCLRNSSSSSGSSKSQNQRPLKSSAMGNSSSSSSSSSIDSSHAVNEPSSACWPCASLPILFPSLQRSPTHWSCASSRALTQHMRLSAARQSMCQFTYSQICSTHLGVGTSTRASPL